MLHCDGAADCFCTHMRLQVLNFYCFPQSLHRADGTTSCAPQLLDERVQRQTWNTKRGKQCCKLHMSSIAAADTRHTWQALTPTTYMHSCNFAVARWATGAPAAYWRTYKATY